MLKEKKNVFLNDSSFQIQLEKLFVQYLFDNSLKLKVYNWTILKILILLIELWNLCGFICIACPTFWNWINSNQNILCLSTKNLQQFSSSLKMCLKLWKKQVCELYVNCPVTFFRLVFSCELIVVTLSL
jgi:hypothetical protein